ncbi:MAG: hypothetical protein KJZ84_24875 [Bryobacteraceae bacterium]|nr:hypothetical protein [Bryobacteraceae bacterium]
MASAPYSLEAWRQFRERKDRPETTAADAPVFTLSDIPADAQMADGLVIGCWNGERFVSWAEWIARAPLALEPESTSRALPDAAAYSATCGSTPVRLARERGRWLMFAGTRQTRRKDFASPFMEHAIRTAEAWYGPAADGWHPAEPTAVAQKEESNADPAQ